MVASARRYDRALGIALSFLASVALLVVLGLAGADGSFGRSEVASLGVLAVGVAMLALAMMLRHAGHLGGATLALGLVAGPCVIIGASLAPFALWAAAAALAQPEQFRAWVGEDFATQRLGWARTLGLVSSLVMVGLVARRLGRPALWDGVAIGAGAMLVIVVFGIAGGFVLGRRA